MKKLMMTTLAALAITAHGATEFNPDTATFADLKAFMDQTRLSVTNHHDALNVIAINRCKSAATRLGPEVVTYLDEYLVEHYRADLVDGLGDYKSFPKSTAVAWSNRNVWARSPYIASYAQKYDSDVATWHLVNKGLTFEELINYLSEITCPFQQTPFADDGHLRNCLQSIQKEGARQVKRFLRRSGKGFVIKNGVNPCAPYMEELNAALNAPRFNGLNEWLAKVGVTNRLDTSRLPTPAQVTELTEKILDGDKEIGHNNYVLRICLGVDGYNAFVKQYNGD